VPPYLLGGILAHCCGANPERLIQAFSDSSLSDFCRVNAYQALLQLNGMGHWSRRELDAWFVSEMLEEEGKSVYLRSYLFTQGLYLVPEIAHREGTAYFESGQGDPEMAELFDPLRQLIEDSHVMDQQSTILPPMGTTEQELQRMADQTPTEEEMRFFDYLDNPESLLDIFMDTDPEYELFERPDIRRNASCPCGSGKKFKKCCINNDFVRIPSSRISWEKTLITEEDFPASRFLEAAFLHNEAGNHAAVVASGLFFLELLKPKIQGKVTNSDEVEERGLFIGYEPVVAGFALFLSSVVKFLIVGSPIGFEVDSEVRWIVDQFGDTAPPDSRNAMLIARAMLDAEVPDRVEYAITDLKQVLEQDPSQMLATMLLADLYQNHPTNPDKAMARKILETRLELEFEEEEDRLAIQSALDELIANILNDE
jgi:hypothetical protein